MSNTTPEVSFSDIDSIYAANDTGLLRSAKNEAGNGSHVSITECAPSHIGMNVERLPDSDIERNMRAWRKSLPLTNKQLGALIQHNTPTLVKAIKKVMVDSIAGVNDRIRKGVLVAPIATADSTYDTKIESSLPKDAEPRFAEQASGWAKGFRR